MGVGGEALDLLWQKGKRFRSWMPQADLGLSVAAEEGHVHTHLLGPLTRSKVTYLRFGILEGCTCAEVHSTTETVVGLSCSSSMSPPC